MAGYSGTPLARKLSIKAGCEVLLSGAPEGYLQLLEPLPEAVRFVSELSESTDIIQVFCVRQAELEAALGRFRTKMQPRAMLWVSWPKKSARVPTDITEDRVRDLALPLGLVDVKVCAVDDIWSGLKPVVRKELR